MTEQVCKSYMEFSGIFAFSLVGSGVVGFWLANIVMWAYKRLTKKEGA